MNVTPVAGCLICGADLVYREQPEQLPCSYCGRSFETEVVCRERHFVCDRCHALPAYDLIEQYCAVSEEVDPLAMATTLMKNPALKMHGPEHHFLVPAVLIAAWCCQQEQRDMAPLFLATARRRAEEVKGGFCGTHGACGAALGAGITISVITGATPLSQREWQMANLATSACLAAVAEAGGPRCCKRDTYLTLRRMTLYLNEHLGAGLPMPSMPECAFSILNRECLGNSCEFHPSHT